MKRANKNVYTLWAIALLVALSMMPRLLKADDSKTDATLRLAGLKGTVQIRRDERGIPYIEAGNEEDLFFAQGYVTATDRLWQMDLFRRTAKGELAEIFGKDIVESDEHFRELGLGKLSEVLFANSSPMMKMALDAYAKGVNACIDSLGPKDLPPEFQLLQYKPSPWRPADSLAVGKTFSVSLSTTWQLDLMRDAFAALPPERLALLFPDTSPLDVILVGSDKEQKRAVVQPDAKTAGSDLLAAGSRTIEAVERSLNMVGLWAENRAASNNWVVNGKRTASGKPLLANDPHLQASAPSIWYMAHLSAPGYRVAGVTAAGLPGILIGHNESIAWGVTNFGPDVQDLYAETFDSANPKQYKTPDGWKTAEVLREEIRVRKGFGSPETETVVHEVITTRHGPIILDQNGKKYALRWTALDQNSLQFETFVRINRARNWQEFCDALKLYSEPSQNFIYADVNGHIGYYAAGKVPIRKSGDGSRPYDGSSDAGEWTGFIPFEKLPHVYDPPSGIIVTANNRTVGSDYPYLLTHEWPTPYRARRIFDLLQAKPKLTAQDFQTIQGDTLSLGGATFAREAVKISMAGAQASGDQKWVETLTAFRDWDGRVTADARAPALVIEMRSAFRRYIITALAGAELAQQYRWPGGDTLLDRAITERPPGWLPKQFSSYEELLRACYQDARAAAIRRMGADETAWKWGHPSLAHVRFPHPLTVAPLIGQRFLITPFPQNGSAGALVTVNVGAAVSMRFIADPADWDATRMGIPLGESGNPSSAHWKDQLDDWRNVTPRLFPFSKAKVAAAAAETVTLSPAN